MKKNKAGRRKANLRTDGSVLGMPRPVDVYVGKRVRLRRTLLGMSQDKLGEAVGLTFQQIQKYERGNNRVGASRLFQLSQVLDVPITYFFDDMPDEIMTEDGRPPKKTSAKTQTALAHDPLARRETLELVRAYYRILDPKVRKGIFELTKSMAQSTADK